ncbi:hypothetical protein KEJ50_04895 [Candidatus Bathyarchaeota archaeon]|nr:hypothetical protein [Candidatus Bathyarchaeota archaeon]
MLVVRYNFGVLLFKAVAYIVGSENFYLVVKLAKIILRVDEKGRVLIPSNIRR